MSPSMSIDSHKRRRLAVAHSLIACMLAVSALPAAAAGPFTYSFDGSEVTDTATGLVWRRCNEGQTWNSTTTTCTGTAATYTHEGALTQAKNQTGWRMPNVKELSSLVSLDRVNPAIDIAAFPSTVSSHYWTSSPYAASSGNAWFVIFTNGSVNAGLVRTGSSYVRLVR